LDAALDESREGAMAPPGDGALRHALRRAGRGDRLSLRDVSHLLRGPLSAEIEEPLAEAATAAREAVFERRVGLFAPLYYSNVCSNDCLYCGFRRSLGVEGRRALSAAEIAAEAEVLIGRGHGRLLLIASEDPTTRGLELAREAIEAVRSRTPIGRGSWSGDGDGLFLAAELAPRSTAEFARLSALGVTAYVLFQETYDPDLYPTVHPSGPKADFLHRLSAPERAAAGGIGQLGLGALFGLGDPFLETIALVAHARHLEMQTGRPVASVSAPRIEPADGVTLTFHPPHPVPDRLWLRLLSVLRLALPQTELIVSTRESIALRRASLRVGATVFSAGSRTDPGGYVQPGESRQQFRVGDERTLEEVIADLQVLG
jgi:2-iminoacetate synthase